MDGQSVFERFKNGRLYTTEGIREFAAVEWSQHPKFEGVELRHIVPGAQTKDQFSYHLVRIAPGKKIGLHTHETQLETHEVIDGDGVCLCGGREMTYESGVIAILPKNEEHEVKAGPNGLLLFAKFFPPLC
ncbi:MAG: cupin domain-containing protein [Synergistaceae bacterium]|nr:cupin domain-containing protein [Synergistaceae bacterium]